MSEIKLISPMLDNFVIGDPINEHHGVRCCPAMKQLTGEKYIVKVITVPPSQTQLEALVLSGAYADKESALSYFKSLADDIVNEVKILNKLASSEGFFPIEDSQIVASEDGSGFDIYLRSAYALTLQRQLRQGSLTHLGTLNLGLDICAALAAARRMGYLYIDLKPENIYIGSANEYRIGDIGFIGLGSLQYASLPDRYHSPYTAPEISDAYSSLNDTLDIYALGLVLYQIFNDGQLPVRDDGGALLPPAYADYEMAEIILKACANDPDERWKNPAELGEALVTYMQRNGAHDTPVTPVADTEVVDAPPATVEEDNGAYVKEDQDDPSADTADAPPAEVETVENAEDIFCGEEPCEAISEDEIYTEDESGNLTLIEEPSDETMTEGDLAAVDYEDVTPEVSEILQQVDDLIDHEAPAPVIQPEPIDVPLPPPIIVEEAADALDETETSAEEPPEPAEVTDDPEMEAAASGIAEDLCEDQDPEEIEAAEPCADELPEEEDEPAVPRRSARKWICGIVTSLFLIALLTAGFFFVKDYFLQRIDSVTLAAGDPGELYVNVSTAADETQILVICADTYGNTQKASLKNGVAFFENLMPNSAYTITVETTGFHYLIGDTITSYTTPNTTEIIQFTAVTGSEDGSAILSFTVSGPDSDSWIITYTKDDGIKESVVFSGHIVTVNGLTPGKEYTFTLTPEKDLDMIGSNTIAHTASSLIKAEKLVADGCYEGSLSVRWSVKEDTQVSGWTVRCYSEAFDTTVTTDTTSVTFNVPDDRAAYTVEVTASGMSVSERVLIPENSTSVKDFAVSNTDNMLVVTWSSVQDIPEGGWILNYVTDGAAGKQIICVENTATLSPVIPDCTYHFTLMTPEEVVVLGGTQSIALDPSVKFEGYNVSADNMEFKMCLTPKNKNWDRYDLSKSDYKTEFTSDKKASFLVRLRKEYDTSRDSVETLFVIRDEAGNIVMTDTSTRTWSNMWYKNYCELDVPAIPQAPGNYSIRIYFNGAFAYEGTFSVTE